MCWLVSFITYHNVARLGDVSRYRSIFIRHIHIYFDLFLEMYFESAASRKSVGGNILSHHKDLYVGVETVS